MRTLRRLVVLWMILACALATAAPPKVEAPPPPGINDPGVSTPAATAPPGTANPAGANANNADDPLAPLPKPDTRIVRDKAARNAGSTSERIAASEVATRKQGNDTVEEYRQNGHVWMIRIVPQNGPTQTFMDSTGNGRLTNDPQQGPISPVYFSLYEWN